jgi:hypothetical protein
VDEEVRFCPGCRIGALPNQPIQHFMDCPEHDPATCMACIASGNVDTPRLGACADADQG